ncbi:unnamed protein product [Closterium sp. NIES-65]|nr:unnamed protein product [Closterium sp. NIES-65]
MIMGGMRLEGRGGAAELVAAWLDAARFHRCRTYRPCAPPALRRRLIRHDNPPSPRRPIFSPPPRPVPPLLPPSPLFPSPPPLPPGLSSPLPPCRAVRCVQFHQYHVVGRMNPSPNDPTPKIYRMKLWAIDQVRAKSKFWYFLSQLRRVKKAHGQVLAINEIFEKNPTVVKNYGMWVRYQSRTGYHNMYKEYRDTTLNGAVQQMYDEMASRHRVRFHGIQIIKTAEVPDDKVKRVNTLQFIGDKVRFPLPNRSVRASSRSLKTTFKASRPNTFV